MPQTKSATCESIRTALAELAGIAILLNVAFPLSCMAQQPGQKTFSSPEAASNALFTAVQQNDEKSTLDLLGADAKQIVSSGDEAEDAQSRAKFVESYREMHRLVKEPDGTTTLYIGARNWPTPIPLVKKASSWYFDTPAAKREILYRRIGRNEMSTIRVCQELVAAENEYRQIHPHEYAGKIVSDKGQHNGLYWPASQGEPQSPVGPLVAAAVAAGYPRDKEGLLTPYRGYYFHLLTRQGKNGPGGAKNYLLDGKMTEGFAFVAFPAQYRSSGVMTFIVGSDGVVYQADLGKETNVVARGIDKFDPGANWQKIQEPSESEQSGR
jgi:hypothetical protein